MTIRAITSSLFCVALIAAGCSDSGTSLGDVAVATATPVPLAPTTNVNPADIVIEDFESEGLIQFSTNQLPLQPLTGSWVSSGGVLATADIPQLLPYYLIADAGSPEGLRQVTMPVTANGAGLTFRFLDVRNHWRLTAAPGFAVWVLSKVVDGQETRLGDTGLADADDGATIGVLLAGDEIIVTVNGQARISFVDDALADAPGTGLVAIGGQSALARWDNMMILAIDYQPPEGPEIENGTLVFRPREDDADS